MTVTLIVLLFLMGYIAGGMITARWMYIIATRRSWYDPGFPAALAGTFWPVGIFCALGAVTFHKLDASRAWEWWFEDPKVRKERKLASVEDGEPRRRSLADW
jgi:uncharacterized membrane protein YraQ (UPF0718 family)